MLKPVALVKSSATIAMYAVVLTVFAANSKGCDGLKVWLCSFREFRFGCRVFLAFGGFDFEHLMRFTFPGNGFSGFRSLNDLSTAVCCRVRAEDFGVCL